MTEFRITAWKQPTFWASADIEADNLADAMEKAKAHDWDQEDFEESAQGDYGPVTDVAALDVESDEEQHEIVDPVAMAAHAAPALLAAVRYALNHEANPDNTDRADYVRTLRAAVALAEGNDK